MLRASQVSPTIADAMQSDLPNSAWACRQTQIQSWGGQPPGHPRDPPRAVELPHQQGHPQGEIPPLHSKCAASLLCAIHVSYSGAWQAKKLYGQNTATDAVLVAREIALCW